MTREELAFKWRAEAADLQPRVDSIRGGPEWTKAKFTMETLRKCAAELEAAEARAAVELRERLEQVRCRPGPRVFPASTHEYAQLRLARAVYDAEQKLAAELLALLEGK